jgi:hypothetical protein
MAAKGHISMKHTLFAAFFLSAAPLFAVETPTMGWSSWNAFRVNISEDVIKHHADLVKELGLADCGYVYINTDDGFFGGRDADGRLKTHPKRFPNGLKPVVDHIHALGLKAGIYSDGGENTCGSIYDNDKMGIGVGLWNHERQDAEYFFKELDFDFIKIDFCGGKKKGNTAGIDMDEKERYTLIRQAVDAAKPGVRINVCRWDYPGTWVGTIGSSWRMSHDIAPKWDSVNGIIHQALYLSAYAGPGSFNDMDMLEVGRGLTKDEDETHFGVWCMMSSPLLIGCDLQQLRASSRAERVLALLKNRELIALDQDPLCRQAYVAKREGEAYVLVKDLETAHGKTRAVAFLNTEDGERAMSIDLADLELAGTVAVRDLFANTDLAPVSGKLAAKVRAHGTLIYRLVAERRLERRVYEGETAWLETYQELQDPVARKTAYYKQVEGASGGVVAAQVGGPGGALYWKGVWSAKGGAYALKLHVVGDGAENVRLALNGADVPLADLSAEVTLRPGDNEVRVFGARELPGIDCLTVDAR